ncbi:hypothetical protein [Bacteroides sp.]|uniref:hypothetical protein n=1 Tax=Bacteroides sp. TaxID=29523 RepID=UPI003AB75DC5
MEEKEKKGCFLFLTIFALASIGIYIGLEFECPFLKNLCMMSSGCAGAFIGSTYLSSKKDKMAKSKWILIALGMLLLAALLTWLMEGKLW